MVNTMQGKCKFMAPLRTWSGILVNSVEWWSVGCSVLANTCTISMPHLRLLLYTHAYSSLVLYGSRSRTTNVS